MPVRETVLLFGPDKSLAGVITDPPPGARADGCPAVVLLSAGLLHRVGPNRLYVRLARRLAARGHVVARFDLSGVGDSRPAGERSDFTTRAIAETRACMDLLASTRRVSRFVVGGLCSGADNALAAAGADPRIVGLALLEPVSAPSAGQIVDSYRDRLLRPSSWIRLLTGRSEAWTILAARLRARLRKRTPAPLSPAVVAPAGAQSAPAMPPLPAGAQADAPQTHAPAAVASAAVAPEAQMRAFASRGGALCLVYSAGNPAHYHYRTVLQRPLEGLPADRLRVEVVPETDHVFTPLQAQARVIDALCDWTGGLGG
jgi:alpha-beta hydrolase superfamily lysophospholipase